MAEGKNRRRPWNISDLSGMERQIAERILSAYFSTSPGTPEGDEAGRQFDAFSRAICDKYGFDR